MTTETLPYRSFDYFAMQGQRAQPGAVGVFGTILIFGPYATRDQVEELCLNRAARLACKQGYAWNPFQVSLIFTPTP